MINEFSFPLPKLARNHQGEGSTGYDLPDNTTGVVRKALSGLGDNGLVWRINQIRPHPDSD